MAAIRIEGREHLPARPAFIVPNRMPSLELLQELESMLGGPSRVAWLVVEGHLPGADIMDYLRRSRAAGIMGSLARQSGIMLAEQIHDVMDKNRDSRRHVVLLAGPREDGDGATLTDVPGALLSHMDGCSLFTVPVYVGMFNEGMENTVTTHLPCHEIRMRVLPDIGGVMQGARLQEAWMECAADMFAELPLPEDCSLARMLLVSMKNHADGKIIDGIDDTELPYHHLLAYALMLGRLLRREIGNKRLGVILPPGKRAALANLACIFAGITPVNINYNAAPEIVRQMMLRAHVTRFITEEHFVSKQSEFEWPNKRDLVFIDAVLEELGKGRMRVWRTLVHRVKTEYLLRYLKLPQRKASDELALVFSGSTAGGPKAIALTHRMALFNLMSLQSRMQLQAGDNMLCAAPLYCSAGFIPGLLMPLLYGYNMVTYPSPEYAGARLRELVLQHNITAAIGTPDLAHALVADGENVPLLSLKHLAAAGGPVPPGVAKAVETQLHTPLAGAYTLAEAGSLVSLSRAVESSSDFPRQAGPQAYAAAIGEPLPGMAFSISDPRQPRNLLPINTPGLLWVRGAAITRGYEDDDEATAANIRNGWLRTGDLAMVDAEGRLHVFGTKERYAVVRGEFIPHAALENILMEGLDAKDTKDGERRLAVVTLTDRDARDHLIMLTTLPPEALPPDISVLRYAIRNEGYSENWCPDVILSVAKIPRLPNGRLDYPAACQLAKQTLERMA